CFAKQITVTDLEFTMPGIREIGEIKPGLIIMPINLLHSGRNTLEIGSLRREVVSGGNHLNIGVLADHANDVIPPEFASWIDVVIHTPIVLCEIDNYINTVYPSPAYYVERRHQERRSCANRRSSYNDGNQALRPRFQADEIDAKQAGHLDFHLDWCKRCLIIEGKKIDLTPKEFELIDLLLTDVDRIFMADEIINHLWPSSDKATKADLYQYMHLLRKKIEQDPNTPKWLMNIKGFGYKLNLN
ncbi:MAG: winged helix-turn-helix domain-containing protein, partial [Methyloglobulus sp.]